MPELKRFVLEYSQPRLSHPDGKSIIREKKEQSFEARDFHDARKKWHRFINEGFVELNKVKHYRTYITLREVTIPREAAQLKPEFAQHPDYQI